MWVFKPILKSVIWGGEKIKHLKKIPVHDGNIGESWEISGLPGAESEVAEGPDAGLTLSQLIRKYGSSILGEKNHLKFGDSFPILVKFIDAAHDLSIQVHPSDEIAQKKGLHSGKLEMWYVLDAEHEAKIANGFNREVRPEEYETLVMNHSITEALNFTKINIGDAFIIPPGRVHAIGKGTLLVEIQQSADITYRIYDYGRKDADGKERELHLKDAFDAINFNDIKPSSITYKNNEGLPVNLITCPHFTVNLWKINEEVVRDYSEWDTFVVIVAIEGEAEITSGTHSRILSKGETLLVPASCRGIRINPSSHFQALETYIK